VDEDEPLEQWAARREDRLRPVGQRKTVIIGHENAAAHLHPALPRLVLAWDGYQWMPETIAENYAAAQRLLHGTDGDGVIRGTVTQPRKKPAGKHRKP
jgi:hypothetical protein